MNSIELNKSIVKISGDTVILMFSRGKDSIASYYQLKKFFKTIHLVYKYRVPELKFVEESLKYFEDKFQQKIIQIPHPAFFNQINHFIFQDPNQANFIQYVGLPTHTQKEFDEWLPIDLDCPNAYIASGVRQNDSLMRGMVIRKYGAFNEKAKTFYPVYDWTNDQIRDCLKENDVKLPIDYEIWGKSMDGIDYRFIKPLKERLPEDYKIVKKYFPLIDLEIMRYEQI
jgi:3'-phosphoadenosine 5'-phosphosulfate sulfotransferase (PAPS reductase)/FAD synthetase